MQVVEPLPGGAALKLTVAKYYTPSGRCIQAVSYRDKDAKKVASTAPYPYHYPYTYPYTYTYTCTYRYPYP